jgi:superfamily II DNA or RNA helicase
MKLRSYQTVARNFIVDRYKRYPGSGLWLGCGLGKTIVSLDAISLLKEYGAVKRVAVVAPARVIATAWPKEIRQWGLDLSWRWLTTHNWDEAISAKPDILFIGCEDLALRQLSDESKAKRAKPQLAERLLKAKFNVDMIVIDEVTKFKSWSAARSKMLRKLVRHIPYRVTLTGSPTPNHLGEIFPQHFFLDNGETLTPYIGAFRDRYMRSCGFEGREWEMRPDMVDPLLEKLKPWYLCQEAVDHLEMPELIENTIEVQLPPAALKAYKAMEKQMYAELESGDSLVALSGGSKYNLCRQMASGVVYGEDKKVVHLHRAKLDALRDLYEEMNGRPLLVAYWFTHEGDAIEKEFPGCARIRGGTSTAQTVDIIRRWNSGELDMIVAQASTISHGVDGLQKGCNDLCWFTLTDNPDIWHQLKWRVYRPGNDGNSVRIHTLSAMSTLDRTVDKVIRSKAANQSDVLRAIRENRE